jgi:hypothetical protein
MKIGKNELTLEKSGTNTFVLWDGKIVAHTDSTMFIRDKIREVVAQKVSGTNIFVGGHLFADHATEIVDMDYQDDCLPYSIATTYSGGKRHRN